MTARLKAPLAYHGGKQYSAARIAGLLPETGAYLEPFAGLCSVLLAKPRSSNEAINDVCGNVTAFWVTVQDDPLWLTERLSRTPLRCEALYERAQQWLADGSIERRERAFWWMVSMRGGYAGTGRGRFSPPVRTGTTGHSGPTHSGPTVWPDISRLAARLQAVTVFDRRDGTALVERYGNTPDRTIYVDPPYPTSETLGEYDGLPDYDRLADALLAAKAMVAVSGLLDDWTRLTEAGWHRTELAVYTTLPSGPSSGRRTEILWTNYDPAAVQPQGRLL